MLRRRAEIPADIVEGPTVLTGDQLAERYGADPADVDLVRRTLAGLGLEITAVHPASRRIKVAGTLGQLSGVFGAELRQVSSPAPRGQGTVTHRYREGALFVPAPLDGVVFAVLGLDTRPQARPHFRATGDGSADAAAQSQTYPPNQVAGIYQFPAGTTGAGQTIAVIELGGGFSSSDLDTYFGGLGIDVPAVTAASVDGGSNAPGSDPNGADVEVALDVDVIGAAAPGAAQVVYFAPNSDSGFIDAISEAVHATPAPIAISISWGQSEDSWTAQGRSAMDAAMADAAALGITVCVASGDNGSGDAVDDGQPHVDFPASSPHALACGGTKLLADAATGTISSEVVWNETAANEGAGGGGVSDEFALPSWQADAGVPARAGSGSGAGAGSRRWRAGGAGCGGQRRPGHRLSDLLRRQGPGRRRHQRGRAAVGGADQPAGGGVRPAVRPDPDAPVRRGDAGHRGARLPRHHQREQRRLRGRPRLGRLLGPGQPRRHRAAEPPPGLGAAALGRQDGGMAVAGAAAFPVREEQVRTRVAFRELAVGRAAGRQDAAPRRNAGVVLLLA